jgi:AAHS family 4-hydroxybenzoate transporter-like MFS transporter
MVMPASNGEARRRTWIWTGALLLALVSEGYDLQAANFAAPGILKSFGITRTQVGPLLSSSLLGVLFGAALIGPLGDRLGRRLLITNGCVAYGLLSLCAAWSTNLPQLIALRFLIGLGLGGVLPNALALASELARRGGEAAAAGLIGIGITIGGVLAGLLASALIVPYGWRSIFVVGGVLPLLIAAALQFTLPESPAVIVRTAERKGEATRGSWLPSPGPLFGEGMALSTLAIWLTFIAILMCVYLLSGWIPLLLNQSGFSASTAALIGAAYHGGGVAGGVAASLWLRRGGWNVVAAFALLACGTMIFLVEGPRSTLPLVAGIAAAGFFVTGSQNAINGAGGASYGSHMRSSGLGWALGVGRLGAVAGPLIGSAAVLLGMKEARQFFALPLIPLGVAAVAALWLSRRGFLQSTHSE